MDDFEDISFKLTKNKYYCGVFRYDIKFIFKSPNITSFFIIRDIDMNSIFLQNDKLGKVINGNHEITLQECDAIYSLDDYIYFAYCSVGFSNYIKVKKQKCIPMLIKLKNEIKLEIKQNLIIKKNLEMKSKNTKKNHKQHNDCILL